MSHHKKKTHRRRGGAWYDPRTWFEKKPEEAIQDAPKAVDQAVKDLTGARTESTGVPGGMPASAPAAAVLGGRRKTRRRKSRKSRRSY
jgi:hypothetical protein